MFYNKHLSNIHLKAKIGDQCTIHAGVHIHERVVIGNKCKIQAMAFIPNGVTLEDKVFVGPHVCFTNDPSFEPYFKAVPTLVKEGAKIGANSTIRAGITIGRNAIVGCGSVVLHDIPDNQVWCGNPAKFIKDLSTCKS